ncbi:MAG TPA: aldehyde dehydrogenase family protein [Lacipirellulaceae bacterium]|nr:aldehyde dehydrogenase family protein [Lacipirellulaceae bacterium]
MDAANVLKCRLVNCLYSRDVGRILRLSKVLEYVMAGIIATEHAPFDGIKQSGLGRDGSHHGIDEDVELKYLCVVNVLR